MGVAVYLCEVARLPTAPFSIGFTVSTINLEI